MRIRDGGNGEKGRTQLTVNGGLTIASTGSTITI